MKFYTQTTQDLGQQLYMQEQLQVQTKQQTLHKVQQIAPILKRIVLILRQIARYQLPTLQNLPQIVLAVRLTQPLQLLIVQVVKLMQLQVQQARLKALQTKRKATPQAQVAKRIPLHQLQMQQVQKQTQHLSQQAMQIKKLKKLKMLLII